MLDIICRYLDKNYTVDEDSSFIINSSTCEKVFSNDFVEELMKIFDKTENEIKYFVREWKNISYPNFEINEYWPKRRFRFKWTVEMAEELNAYHAIDAEAELTRLLNEELANHMLDNFMIGISSRKSDEDINN